MQSRPQTINKDDVATILGHFTHLQNKARLDRLDISINDMMVGVLYGEHSELSANYKNIDKVCPVYIGAVFWEHITGDKNFYHRLAHAFGEVVEEERIDGSELINRKVSEIADEIRERGAF